MAKIRMPIFDISYLYVLPEVCAGHSLELLTLLGLCEWSVITVTVVSKAVIYDQRCN